VESATLNLGYTDIVSPVDGTVVSRNVTQGQTVAASLQTPTLFLIANDLTRMQILANIDEADVGKVKEGLLARFTVDAFPGEPFQGHIREVRQAPTTIQNVVTYAAVIDAPNPERKLRQGMTASVTIVAQQRAEALRVPNAALRWRPANDGAPGGGGGGGQRGGGGGAGVARAAEAPGPAPRPSPRERGEGDLPRGARRGRVYRLEGDKAVPVDVQVGISDGRQTEVLSGLAEGAQVVVGDLGGSAQGGPGGGPRRGLF